MRKVFAALLIAVLFLVGAPLVHAMDEVSIIADSFDYLEFYSSCGSPAHGKLQIEFRKAKAANSAQARAEYLRYFIGHLKACAAFDFGTSADARDVGPILGSAAVFWGKDRTAFVAALKTECAKQGFNLSDAAIAAIPIVETPEDLCPTTRLLNMDTALGPFRMTDQFIGNCYVHAAVKAADYFNYSRGRFDKPTSIAGISILANGSRKGGLLAVEGGYSEDVIGFLAGNGGCQISDLDGEMNLNWLEDFYKDVTAKQAELLAIPDIEVPVNLKQAQTADLYRLLDWFQRYAEISKDWKPGTIAVLNNIVLEEREAAKKALTQAGGPQSVSIDVMSSYIRKIISLTNGFRTELKAQGTFLNFAGFMLKKTFCSRGQNQFAGVDVEMLKSGSIGSISPKEFVAAVKKGFSQPGRQPLLLSFCSSVLGAAPGVTGITESTCGSHAVLITGQQYDSAKKACMIQILNSWGTNGWPYHKDYPFDPVTGSAWVPAETLGPATFRLSKIRAR